MITYPLTFFGSAQAGPGMKESWQTGASDFHNSCCVPVEFDGAGGHHSPEDFFLLALQNCFVATFKVYAEHSKLTFLSLDVKGELIVDKNEQNRPVMKQLNIHIDLKGASDVNRGRSLIKKALDSGFILQSVKTEVVPEIHVS